MPVRRRRARRRASPETEAEAWALAFASGHDFLGTLEDFGLAGDEAVREAMPDAWARLGRLYLDRHHDPVIGTPWAQEAYGEPEQCR